MKYFINDDLALSRPPEGPVTRYIVSFADWLVDRGYGLVSLRNKVLMAAGFSTWLRQKGIELSDVSEEHAERYLLDRAQRPKRGDRTDLSRGDVGDEGGGVGKDAPIFRQVIPLPARRQSAGILEQPLDRADYVGWSGRFCRKSLFSSDVYRCGSKLLDIVGRGR